MYRPFIQEKIDRGGKIRKMGGGGEAISHLGGSGGMLPQEMFMFRLSYIVSGAFLRAVMSVSGVLY